MDDMMYRRRMLLSQLGIKRFIIFLNELLAGDIIKKEHAEIIDNEHAEDSSGYIDVKGYHNSDTVHNYKPYFKYHQDADGTIHYDIVMNTVESLTQEYTKSGYTLSTSKEPWTFYITDTDENTLTVHWFTDTGRYFPGFITIGSYSFTGYKTLNFTVEEYKGAGTISFGDFSQVIDAVGVYSINIKDYDGSFDIKFGSDSFSGYSVNNVYLEG